MKKYLLVLIAGFLISGCTDNDAEKLKGKNFVLLPKKSITLSFDAKENRFSGKALNNYFGNYSIDKENITLNSIGSTMMAGPENEMKQEQAYFEDLAKIKTYSYKNKTLELKGDNITLTYQEQ